MSIATEPVAGLFASPAALRTAFEQGLEALLLQHDLLGVFILVLANASYERPLFERLRTSLADAYARWCARFDAGDERALAAAADDVEVFQWLRRLGIQNLAPTRFRQVDDWELQYNPLRALRPPRMSDAQIRGLREPFDPDGFHFNKPFLRKEILWEGELAGTSLRLLYNKFPFADLHGLLVPQPAANRPQYLQQGDHALMWQIAGQLGESLPGIGFGYNAYGAYASVNHLHFHTFMRTSGVYPVEQPQWRHNGGARGYPLPVQCHTDRDAAWSALSMLHVARVAYNLLYRPGRLYIAPRAMQGSYRHSGWTGGFAWSEVAGGVTLSDAAEFDRLRPADIEAELAALALRP